jgi:hypothetical protein
MIQWRQLFDSLNIEWKDRGKNCSRGHVNISCIFCKDDPSQHLTISEETGQYYCYRNSGHGGKSTPWLLLHLGVESYQIDQIISDFSDERKTAAPIEKRVEYIEWDKFEAASDYQICLDYLELRGFDNPEAICKRYDLRFTKYGTHSWRLLFPLTAVGKKTGFTGRALRSSQSPRYLTNDPFSCSLFQPNPKSTHCLFLCEGSFDALVVAEADPFFSSKAMLGISLPIERRMCLAELAKLSTEIFYCPDADQSRASTYRLIEELEGTPAIRNVRLAILPEGSKDLAQFYESDKEGMKQWLKKLRTFQRGKDLFSRHMQSSS